LVLMALIGLGSACSSPPMLGTTTPSTSSSSTTSLGTTVSRSPSPPLVAGTAVPGYRVGPLSFVSPSRGYGLVEFDTTGQSTAQQLVVTEDGGVTWQAATSTPLPAWASMLEFTDANDGYAWGGQGLDVTHDGGEHWELSLSLATASQAVSPIGRNIWAISASDVLETSSDGGNSWQKAVQPPVSNLADLSRVSTSVAYILSCSQTIQNGSQPGDLARTEDGGQTWQILPLPQGCAGGQSDLVSLSTDDLWFVQFSSPATDMSSKWVYRSYDGGAHWTLMASENIGNPNEGTGRISSTGDFGPLSVLASEPNRAWLAEDRGGLLVTTDGGATWQFAYGDPNVDAFGPPFVSFLDASHGWSATGDGLWRTTDGITWTEISQPSSSTNQ
jgi:photosystem II stability/assembly factor-like uncharacterized protein